MSVPITFYAAVAKVTTLADGAIRIYLDLPEHATITAAKLMECKRFGIVLDFEATKHATVTDCNDEAEKEPEGGGPNLDRNRITIRRDQ